MVRMKWRKRKTALVCAFILTIAFILATVFVRGNRSAVATVAAADNVVFSESFDSLNEALELFPDWYSSSWEKVKLKNGTLEFGGVLLRHNNYSDYLFSGELGESRGSNNGKEKVYLLLKQPAGFGVGENELGLAAIDAGNGNDARPGFVGILLGATGDTVEVIIHTLNIGSTGKPGNVAYRIALPEGMNFSKNKTNFEIEDRDDHIDIRFGHETICVLELSGARQCTVNDWTDEAYTVFQLKAPDGTMIGSGDNALIPCSGSVGLLAQGVVGKVDSLTLISLADDPADSIVSPVFFDESRILLQRGQTGVTQAEKKIIGIPEICILVIIGVLAAGACIMAVLLSKNKTIRLAVSGFAVLTAAVLAVLVLTGVINYSGVQETVIDADNMPNDSEELTLDARGNTPSKVIKDDHTATDLLGRRLPSYDEVGPAKKDKYVGVFYTLWTCMANSLSDNTKNIAQNPKHPTVGTYASFHWFTEPETGYSTSLDEWVVRRNLRYLAMAGVDYIYLDFTNGGIYEDAFTLLLETSLALRAEGNDTPAIVPWIFASDTGTMTDAGYVYRKFYSQEKYRELWFYVDGKPLILLKRVEEDIAVKTWPKTYLPVLYNTQFSNFFTTRFAWVPSENDNGKYPGQPVYRWSWCNPLFMHNYKSDAIAYSWDTDPAIAEQVTIIGGSYCNIGYGRSGEYGTLDQFREKEVSGQGLYLEEQFEWVMQNHPEVTFLQISGWNEWIAQYFEGTGSFGFVDTYNREFSRDLAPIKGGYEDNYFYQMCSIIRRFKGVEPQEEAKSGSINIDGGFAQWDNTGTSYEDYTGDTTWRDSTDTTGTIKYVDETGRNDIASCKVVCDSSYVYFYVDTAEPLKEQFGKNWMLLFIDTDNDVTTGFEGYDRLLNYALIDNSRTAVCAFTNNVWQEIGSAEYRTDGNKLMLKVARSMLDQTGNTASFAFHWLDNATNIYDTSDWFLTGDSAPERRARFTFSSVCKYDAGGEKVPEPRTDGRILYMPALEGDEAAATESGLSRKLYNLTSDYGKQPEIRLLKQKKTTLVKELTIGDIKDSAFAAEFDGYVFVSADDIYDMTIRADDGVVLFIDGRKVIDLSGVHKVQEKSTYLPLAAGYHTLKIEYFENGDGGAELSFAAVGRSGGNLTIVTGI